MNLDSIDLAILRELQNNARIANVDLAEKVRLSPSACSRRLDHLEVSGVIEGYQARISNHALGQNLTAIISITLEGQSEAHLGAFEKAIRNCPGLVACFLMSGDSDYIVRMNARDMEHFEHIHKNWLSTLPGVARIHSSFAMREIVNIANIDLAQPENIRK